MGLYEYFERKLSWHYLNGPGEDLWRTLADAGEEVYDAVKDAVLQRFLNRCHDEAVPWIAQTFNLDYPSRYTAAQARSYIGDPFTHWADAGSRGRMIAEVQALGYSNVQVWSYRNLVDDAGTDPNITFGGISSFWFLLIKPPFPWPWDVAGRWGPPPVGSGALWGAAPFKWGVSGLETWHIDEIRRVIKKWKPAGSSCRFIEVWLRVNFLGLPIEVRRFPVHEDWEFGTNGAARDFYNYSHQQEVS